MQSLEHGLSCDFDTVLSEIVFHAVAHVATEFVAGGLAFGAPPFGQSAWAWNWMPEPGFIAPTLAAVLITTWQLVWLIVVTKLFRAVAELAPQAHSGNRPRHAASATILISNPWWP